jgi:hypothetical protein
MCEDDLPLFNHKVEPGLVIPSDMKVGSVIIFITSIVTIATSCIGDINK